MLSRTYQFLIPETTRLFNEGKIPHQQLTKEQIEDIVKGQFKAFREYGKKPYHHTLRLPKFITLKLRYRYIRAKIGDLVKKAKNQKKELNQYGLDWEVTTDITPINAGRPKVNFILSKDTRLIFEDVGLLLSQHYDIPNNKEHLQDLLDLEAKITDTLTELRYWWALKNKWILAYQDSPKYKRLQVLRKAWQDSERGITMKDDYRIHRLTQIGQDDEENEVNKRSIHKIINEDNVKGNKRARQPKKPK